MPATVSSLASGERTGALLELVEGERAARRIAAYDPGSAGVGGRHDRRRRHDVADGVDGGNDAENALVEAEHEWNRRALGTEKNDDVLVDGKFRRADDDAAKAAQLTAGHAKAQRL